MHRLTFALVAVLVLSSCGSGADGSGSGSGSGRPGAAAGGAAPVSLAHTVSGAGPAVVLLHGFPQTQASWRSVVPTLARSHRVVVVDQRGQGASPAPDGGYDTATRARDVAALLRELGITGAAVVGVDLGGQVAYALARDNPELVSRLVVLEAVIPGTRAAVGPLTAPHIAEFAALDGAPSAERVRDFVCADRDPCPYPADLLTIETRAVREESLRPYAELAAAATGPAPAPGRVDVPVLAVGGSKGIGSLPADSLREVAGDVTGVVLPGATHWLAEESPAQLLAVLQAFLTAGRPG